MAQEVYMDIPVVEGYAKTFAGMSQIIKDCSKTIEGIMAQVRDADFLGYVGDNIYNQWSTQMKPELDKLAAKLEEVSVDITGAIQSYRDGDASGSQHYV